MGSRGRNLVLALCTIAAGLAVHRGLLPMSTTARDIVGDALWAMMIVWLVGAAAPRTSLWSRGIAALAICFAVEFSQLVRTPWLDAIRRTAPGHLVVGSGFDPRDLLAYTAGVLLAVGLS